MKTFFLSVFVLIVSFGFAQDFQGRWDGALSVNGTQLPIVFHLQHFGSDSLTGTWDSPMQNAMGLKFSSLSSHGDSLITEVSNIAARYLGKLIGKDSLSGVWRQGTVSFPLGMKRGKEVVAVKNKDEREVEIPAYGGVTLSGSLISKSTQDPLVIIVAGSGPTDRNGNNPLGVHSDTYLLLAEALAEDHISTFRYDKRGIGKSHAPNLKESDLVFTDFSNDVINIVKYFRKEGFSRIFIAGHSEGSLLGMLACEKEKADGYISIAGAGIPIGEILKKQLSGKVPGVSDSTTNRIIDELGEGKTPGQIPPMLMSVFRPSIQPYLISWMRIDPRKEIQKVGCPVLILQGTCDIQVSVDNATALFNAAGRKAEIKIISGMSHVLKDAGQDCKNEQLTYTDNALPVSKELVQDISDFVRKN